MVYITSFLANDFYNLLLGPFELDSETVSYIINNNDSAGVKNFSITYNGVTDHSQEKFFPQCFTAVIGDKYYFKVNTKDSVDTDFTYSSNEKEIAKILLVPVGENYIILKKASGPNKKSYDGILTYYDFSKKELLNSTNGIVTNENICPYMLNTLIPFKGLIRIKLILCSVGLLFILFNFYKILKRSINTKNHPIYDNIGIYGDEEEIIKIMNTEVKDTGNEDSKVVVTPTWTFRKTFLKLIIKKN